MLLVHHCEFSGRREHLRDVTALHVYGRLVCVIFGQTGLPHAWCACFLVHASQAKHFTLVLSLPHTCAYPNQCRLLTAVVQITIFKVGWFICDTPDTLVISVWIPTVILQQFHLWVNVFSVEHLFGFLRVPREALGSRHSD